MAVELSNAAVQTVAAGQNVLFSETPVSCNRGNVIHREGSGLVTLRGNTNQCRARYKVAFGANITVATGGTVGAVTTAISLNGEAVAASAMTVTPAAIGDYFNVARTIFVDVPRGCCYTVAVENTSATSIDAIAANLVIERVA